MPEHVSRGFPLFPLGIVALPGEHVPLHIFEDRYRRMIEQCLRAEEGSLQREFGIIWLSDEELKEVGCACQVERVIERLDDGRLNILALGTRPFRLLERQHELPYPAGVVEFLEDSPDQAPASVSSSGEDTDEDVAAQARELYGELVEHATDRQLSATELAAMSAYEMAATVEFGTDAKQELLELRSEQERLRLLALLLRAALDRLALIDRAQARAASNGKVRFS
jgi:Lon protease-like protein